MKKLREWWYSYRLIVCLLSGASALLNNAKYNKVLNLATARRQGEWCISTYSYVDLGPFSRLVAWRIERFRKKIEAFNFHGYSYIDLYDTAMQHYNAAEHKLDHPEMREAMANFNASEEGQRLIAENTGDFVEEFPDVGVVQDPNWVVGPEGKNG